MSGTDHHRTILFEGSVLLAVVTGLLTAASRLLDMSTSTDKFLDGRELSLGREFDVSL